MEDTVYQLKITLRSVKPPVWRRIVVRSDADLAELAAILEAAMGWLGGHLHAFESADARYAMPDPEWPDDDLDERAFQLRDVLPDMGSKLRWDYDFGDGWEHDVAVEGIGPQRSDFDGRSAWPEAWLARQRIAGGQWATRTCLTHCRIPHIPSTTECANGRRRTSSRRSSTWTRRPPPCARCDRSRGGDRRPSGSVSEGVLHPDAVVVGGIVEIFG